MDKFVGDLTPTEKEKTDWPNQSKCQPKRKYDEAYLVLGFTVAEVGDEE